MTRSFFTAILAGAASIAVIFFFIARAPKLEQEISRAEYEAFLLEHEYYKHGTTEPRGEEAGEKRRDRPDLRMQQEFLMTMNPALRRPTPEKLSAILEETKNARTMGTLPGEPTAAWVERGPNNIGGRTRALMWDPNDATGKKVWAAGVSGGLWYNNDITSAAASWVAVDDFWSNLAVSCIAYDPNNTQIFYAGTGEGFSAGSASAVRGQGIWKSADGGQTWAPLTATSEFYFVSDLVVRSESGSSILYAGIVGKHTQGVWFDDLQGLQKSSDGGTSFTQVLPNVAGETYSPGVADIEVAQDNKLWIGTYSASYGKGGGMVMSSADGVSWQTNYTSSVSELSGRVELATAPSNALLVYALIENDTKIFEMKVSADAGVTWSNMNFPDDDDNGIDASDFTRGQAWYDLISAVDPADDSTVVIGGINLHMSTDAGQTWKQISKWSNNANMGEKAYSYVHADMHAIQFKPGSSSEVIFGTDGGVFWTNNITDAATSNVMAARNTNYNVTQFYTAAIHPFKGKDYFLAGAQDNGTQKFSTAGINATEDVKGGDGAYCFIDQTDGSNQIASYVYNDYSFSDSEWTTVSDNFSSDDATGHFINPADYDDEQNILYSAATETAIARFYKTDGGFTRSDLQIGLGTKASNIKVSPHTRTSSTLFIGTAAGKLFKVTNADTDQPQVSEITAAFPAGWISSIEVGQTENHLLVTFSNYGVASVWYTTNGSTWTSKEGNLPDMPVRWALFNPTNYDEVILATEMGIWGTKSISATSPVWAQFNNGLANVRVDMLQIRASDYEVIAATHGRGLFSSGIFGSQAPLTANFVAKNRKIDAGGTVQFTDLSIGATAWEWTFQGGTPSTSTSQTPLVIYEADGNYSVTLKAKSSSGASVTKIIEGYVAVGDQSGAGGCSGSKTLSPVTGAVSDGSGESEYGNDLSCEWLISPAGATTVTLTFSAFDTEADFDFLYIYKGEEAIETMELQKLSGSTVPEPIEIDSGVVLLKFVTDVGIGGQGWALSYTSDGVPAPSNLVATALSARKVELSWTDNISDETGFLIERSTDGSTFSELIDVSAGVISYTDTELEPETAYYYRVRTVRDDVTSAPGNLALATTLAKGDPDIEVTDLQYEFLDNGGQIHLNYTLSNGTEEATLPFTVQFYLSEDEQADAGDQQLGTADNIVLDPESETVLSDDFEMAILPPGEYFLLAIADEAAAVAEVDETNNQFVVSIILSPVLAVSPEFDRDMLLYPNPASNWITVEFSFAPKEAVDLRLFDMSGRRWKEWKLAEKSGRIGLEGVPRGVYFISAGGGEPLRFIKQ